MYRCSKCGKGVLVTCLPSPVRACKCTVLKERKAITKLEKFLSFFGKKFYIEKLAPISLDIKATASGYSKFSN